MSSRVRGLTVFLSLAVIAMTAAPAAAQGLIWRLPAEENFLVQYYGTYTQKDVPVGGVDKPLISWDRELIVKSLKKAKGYHKGKEVDCRWLEISVRTGRLSDGEIDAGPAGRRVYKLLVPESAIVGKATDADAIFVSLLPIATDKAGKIQGIRKIGESTPQPIKSPVLQVYPVLTLLSHYRTLSEQPGQATLTINEKKKDQAQSKKLITPDQYKNYTGKLVTESTSSRSTNTATFAVTDQVPTGLAQWKVTLTLEKKNSAQSRKEFQQTSQIVTTLTARKITFNNVQSELPDP